MQAFLPHLQIFFFFNFILLTVIHLSLHHKEQRTIGLVTLTLTGHSAFLVLSSQGWLAQLHWAIPVNMSLGLFFPLTLLYHVRMIMGRKGLPLLPYYLAFAGTISFFLLHIGLWILHPSFGEYLERVQDANDFPVPYLAQLLMLQLLDIYCCYLIFRETTAYEKRVRQYASDSQDAMIRYLRFFRFFLAFVLGLAVLLNLIFPTFWAHYLLVPLGFYVFYTVAFTTFHRMPSGTLDAHNLLLSELNDLNANIGQQPFTSEAAQMTLKVQEHFTRPKLYTNPKLTINQVAERLDVPGTAFSDYLKNELGINFFEFVNTHRVAEAKRLIERGVMEHLTLEAIGREAGFASRTSFYRAFKKHEGQTPKDFLENVREAGVGSSPGV